MLSHHHSLAYQFVTTHFELLLAIAFAWALFLTFWLSNNWCKRQGVIWKTLDISITAAVIALVNYLPFIALALGVKWGWFY